MHVGVPTWLRPASPRWGQLGPTPEARPPEASDVSTALRAAGRFLKRLLRSVWFWILAVLAGLAFAEMRFSWLQSKLLAFESAKLVYHLDDGPSPAFAIAPNGPYDLRLGYVELPAILNKLTREPGTNTGHYRIVRQARSSEFMLRFTEGGGYPVYPEKSQAGLRILDRSGEPLFNGLYPHTVYHTFDQIPPLVVRSLLYIENRKILDDDRPYLNPAVEWNRLAKAAGDLAINKVYPRHPISGGSTLATQLEKVRHSPDGRTASTVEKFRQMLAASLRAYRNGENSSETRRDIVRDYLNSFPLGALPGYGEVAGLPEGMLVFYGADPAEANRLLALPDDDTAELQAKAVAYRQALSLLLALNRPYYYLRQDTHALDERVDAYLRVFAEQGVISAALSEEALRARPVVRAKLDPDSELAKFALDKGTLALRADLLGALGVPNTYALDRMDATVSSTLSGEVQQSVSRELRAITDPAYAAKAGLSGANLLGPSNDGSVIFSFTLYERTASGNLLRVESDNYDQPLSINRGTRLELGSTAKLRTLVSYLEIVWKLHEQYVKASPEELRKARWEAHDPITRWALNWIAVTPDPALRPMLEAALDRPYSADTKEKFFTAGGIHTFSNFEAKDNGAIMPVRQGFRRSVNLVFIRLMRDVEDYYKWRLPVGSPAMLDNPSDPMRQAFLTRFASLEGHEFLQQFWNEHRGETAAEMRGRLADSTKGNLRKLTVIFRAMDPKAPVSKLREFLQTREHVAISESWAEELYRDYAPERFNWNDLGYLADLHPLELWLLRFKYEHPDGSLAQASSEASGVYQEIYQWLFRKKNFKAQNSRIEIVLERDAFQQIHQAWQRQGYPFPELVPSYASALGSSGDNPAALAELAGIILNGGVRMPSVRVTGLHFAEGTPYETDLKPMEQEGVRVYPEELASVVKNAMFDVVQNGTARRAFGSVVVDDHTLAVGGKTGTGDNRIEVHNSEGRLVDSRAINRTATFVFVIGERFFGTITAYVPGADADRYKFTSALPTQLFRHLVPRLEPLLRTAPAEGL